MKQAVYTFYLNKQLLAFSRLFLSLEYILLCCKYFVLQNSIDTALTLSNLIHAILQ